MCLFVVLVSGSDVHPMSDYVNIAEVAIRRPSDPIELLGSLLRHHGEARDCRDMKASSSTVKSTPTPMVPSSTSPAQPSSIPPTGCPVPACVVWPRGAEPFQRLPAELKSLYHTRETNILAIECTFEGVAYGESGHTEQHIEITLPLEAEPLNVRLQVGQFAQCGINFPAKAWLTRSHNDTVSDYPVYIPGQWTYDPAGITDDAHASEAVGASCAEFLFECAVAMLAAVAHGGGSAAVAELLAAFNPANRRYHGRMTMLEWTAKQITCALDGVASPTYPEFIQSKILDATFSIDREGRDHTRQYLQQLEGLDASQLSIDLPFQYYRKVNSKLASTDWSDEIKAAVKGLCEPPKAVHRPLHRGQSLKDAVLLRRQAKLRTIEEQYLARLEAARSKWQPTSIAAISYDLSEADLQRFGRRRSSLKGDDLEALIHPSLEEQRGALMGTVWETMSILRPDMSSTEQLTNTLEDLTTAHQFLNSLWALAQKTNELAGTIFQALLDAAPQGAEVHIYLDRDGRTGKQVDLDEAIGVANREVLTNQAIQLVRLLRVKLEDTKDLELAVHIVKDSLQCFEEVKDFARRSGSEWTTTFLELAA